MISRLSLLTLQLIRAYKTLQPSKTTSKRPLMSSQYSEACLAHTNSALPSVGADGKSGSGASAGDGAGAKVGTTGAADGGTTGSGAGATIGAAGGCGTIGAAAACGTPCAGAVGALTGTPTTCGGAKDGVTATTGAAGGATIGAAGAEGALSGTPTTCGGAKNGAGCDGEDGSDAATGSNTPCKSDPGVAIGAAATTGAAGGATIGAAGGTTIGAAGGITIGDADCTPGTGAGGTNDPGASTGELPGKPTTWDGVGASAVGNKAPGAAIGIVIGGATGSSGTADDPVCDGGSRLIGAGRNDPGAIGGGTCDGASGGSLKEKPGSPPTGGPVGACGDGGQLLKGRRIGPRRPGLVPIVGGGAARRTGLSVSGGSSDSDSKSDSGIASRKEVVPSAHGAEGGNGRMSGRVNGMNGALGLGLIMDVGRTPARRRSSLPQRSCGNVPGASAGEAPPCSSLAEDSIGMGMATTGPKASAR
ncbi:hypothetical protein EXIGLDRAFT_515030 [Exidia glandulosa HHB12029]|uniref:Uncharacterized protein n=1 Tax=Exidia glandulosa HHB12029 TaxID=1314781 RepID=A0A165J8M3_EXIGL|nr:hypothetical protein EXIGLDRAFT_515030 [Exidia glandulosa HHB12029]